MVAGATPFMIESAAGHLGRKGRGSAKEVGRFVVVTIEGGGQAWIVTDQLLLVVT